jgi:hypothetical protein
MSTVQLYSALTLSIQTSERKKNLAGLQQTKYCGADKDEKIGRAKTHLLVKGW